MTLRAREVLEDARLAHQHLDQVLDLPRFRLFWAASCALLRAVGHVLDKVDGEKPEYREAIADAWRRWKADRTDHAIFWDFIEVERNLILKEYEIRVDVADHTLVVEDPFSGETSVEKLGPEYYVPLTEGPFASWDCRELVREALDWWERQLSLIEADGSTG